MSLQWNGDEWLRRIREEADKRIGAAAVTFQSELKRVLSVSYPPASKPGEAPHGRTWNLRNAVLMQWVQGTLTAKVGLGPQAPYGQYLEGGTVNMAARPWFIVTLDRLRPLLEKIIGGEHA